MLHHHPGLLLLLTAQALRQPLRLQRRQQRQLLLLLPLLPQQHRVTTAANISAITTTITYQLTWMAFLRAVLQQTSPRPRSRALQRSPLPPLLEKVRRRA